MDVRSLLSQPFPFAGAGEMGARIRDHRWTATRLGDMREWSPTLRSTLGICLHSTFPTAIYWGDEHHLFYNDAWAPIAGTGHPHALGRPAHEVCHEAWAAISPHVMRVHDTGQGIAARDAPLPPAGGDLYWDYSLAPITEPDGTVAGVLSQGQETSARVHAARRHALLEQLDDATCGSDTADAMIDATLPLIAAALAAPWAGIVGLGAGDRTAPAASPASMPALADIARAHRLAIAEGAIGDALAAGQTHAIEDPAHDPLLSTAARESYAAIGVRAVLFAPVMRQDGQLMILFACDNAPRRWTAHARACAAAAGERLGQAIARTRAGSALRNAAERHRLIFERTGAILFSADREGRLTACNPAATHAFDRPAAALVLHPLQSLIAGDGYERLTSALAQAHGDGEIATIDVAVSQDGQVREWDVTATPAVDPYHAGGFHAVARDVTARRAVERRQRVLINELNHRVKNTLALVQGLAFQTFRPDRDTGASRAAFEGRLAALARAHDVLTAATWDGAALADIAHAATQPARNGADRIRIDGPGLTIAPKPAIALALALHELTANAVAYGALREAAGCVALGWTIADGRLRLVWQETAAAPVAEPAGRPGFGLRLVQRMLAAEFGGTVRIEFCAMGLSCTLDAPLPLPSPDIAPAT